MARRLAEDRGFRPLAVDLRGHGRSGKPPPPVPEEPSPAQSQMATAALRRRVVWPFREEMVRSYGSRPPLDRLAPEALAACVEWGTDELEDGQVALSCPPAVEAAIFGGLPALPRRHRPGRGPRHRASRALR